MIIICPNCQAQYEVASNAIGNAGRKVQCASCQTNWRAVGEPEPEPAHTDSDKLFDAGDEAALDADFEKEEEQFSGAVSGTKPAPAPKKRDLEDEPEQPALNSEKIAMKRKAMLRRQYILHRNLPQARLRRGVIMVSTILLMTIIGGALVLRDNLVRGVPDLAGLYSAVGININVLGLEFRDVNTLKFLRDGVVVMQISAMLENISSTQVPVPPVLVSLDDDQGRTLYSWRVTPSVSFMGKGEWVTFSTELAAPPLDVTSVNLTFDTSPASSGE
jgi:predicted Zn finger-like uncharacterized protein